MRRSINRWFGIALGAAAILGAPAVAADKAKPPTPTGNPGTWFTDDDFPADAKRAGQDGRVAVELAIGADGRVTGCTVVVSSNSPALDETTCRLAQTRGTFRPALDAAGNPVAATFKISTRWVLRSDLVPIVLNGAAQQASVLRIDAAGKVLTCIDQSLSAIIDAAYRCPLFSRLPTTFGLSLRGANAGADPVEVTIERAMYADGERAPRMAYEASDRVVTSLTIIRFTVDAAGSVRDCKVVKATGQRDPRDPCTPPPGPFVPPGKTRAVTLKVAVSHPRSG